MASTKEARLREKHKASAIRVDLHNQVEVKIALDDFIKLVAEELYEFEVDNKLTDLKLVLGYVACVIAGTGAFYSYIRPFEETKLLVVFSVISYFVLTTIMNYVSYYFEGNALFRARKRDPLGLEPDLFLSVKTDLQRYDIGYDVVFSAKSGTNGTSTEAKLSTTIDRLFDWDGNLVFDTFLQLLKPHLTQLTQTADKKRK